MTAIRSPYVEAAFPHKTSTSSRRGIIRFEKIANFRDVGAFVNAISGRRRIKENILFRSARPDFATPSDREVLSNSLKIRTIVDLRSSTERKNLPRPSTAASTSTPTPLLSDVTTSTPLPLPITVRPISLSGRLFQLRLLSYLPFTRVLLLIYLRLTSRPIAAIRVLSAAMGPRGLLGLAVDTLHASWLEVREIFTLLADEANWPVLLHCTQGKDRTGLIVLLLLLVAGEGQDGLRADYCASDEGLRTERGEREGELKELGLPQCWAGTEDGWVEGVVGYMRGRWGGVGGYLDWCGVPVEQAESVRRILLIDSDVQDA